MVECLATWTTDLRVRGSNPGHDGNYICNAFVSPTYMYTVTENVSATCSLKMPAKYSQ